MDELKNRVAVVTGAAGGIGAALVCAFADAGMDIVLADRDVPGMEVVAERVRAKGRLALCQQTDVTDPASLERLLAATLDAFGRCHLVANNAGVFHAAPLLDTAVEQYRRVVETNLLGVIWGSRVFGTYFRKQGEGHIINTSSAAGLFPVPGMGSYSTTKYGVVGFSLQLRWELAATGVGVTVLCPGTVRTGIAQAKGVGLEHIDMAAMMAKAPPPEPLAKKTVQAVLHNRPLVRYGPESAVFTLLRLLPLWIVEPLGRFMGRKALEVVQKPEAPAELMGDSAGPENTPVSEPP